MRIQTGSWAGPRGFWDLLYAQHQKQRGTTNWAYRAGAMEQSWMEVAIVSLTYSSNQGFDQIPLFAAVEMIKKDKSKTNCDLYEVPHFPSG